MKNLWQIAQKINMEAGRIQISEPMAAHTTFRIGGPADIFIRINSPAELGSALARLADEGIPRFILGKGANILVGDEGIRGAVLDLSGLSWARSAGASLKAGAGLSVNKLCEDALALELCGLENFYGMPGSLGGAIYMNARCYEKDFSETIVEIDAISPDGEEKILHPRPDQWAYKKSPFQPGGTWAGWIIVGATFALGEGKAERDAGIMRSRKLDRIGKGHYRLPSAGSVFKNNRAFGRPTGAILDSLGMKGARIGDAAVSTWHANIFVNEGKATARDMRALIEKAQAMALSAYGFELEPEVLFIGEF
ncbi:MAG TPA: UDP-N-acetylmuramate dehydrogenase [Rectinemataceae bacterium]|nr:UDP-N-acetylmuramate dehydrogenase [Rectinemataceae bacterium]